MCICKLLAFGPWSRLRRRLPRQTCGALGGDECHLQAVALAGKGVQNGGAGLQRLVQHTAAGGHAGPRPGIVFSLPEAQQAPEGSG